MKLRTVRCITLTYRGCQYTRGASRKTLCSISVQIMSNNRPSISLQSKVSLTLVLLITIFVVLSYSILRIVIAPAFDELENSAAKSDLYRAEAALRTDIENLEAITADWAPWDDIYYYVSGANPGFRKSNLDRPTLDNLDLDLMAIFSTESRFVWGQVLVDGEEVAIGTLDILNPEKAVSLGLTAHNVDLDRTVGFIQTTHGPMMISSRPILRSDDSGPIAGAIVMGQLLDDSALARLRERTEVDMSWEFVALGFGGGDALFETATAHIAGTKVLNDIHDRPLLVLRTKTPRSISDIGAQTINAATLFLIIAGALVCAFIWFMLRFTILDPIEKLTHHIDDIRESGDLSRQLSLDRADEIGLLGRQFDSMTADVHEARKALVEQSFKAGKADTAAEVMHNIRNAMTPMINGLDRLRKSFKITETLRVTEALEQVANEDCSDDRREKFLEYIRASFDRIETVNNDAADDLNVVTSQAKQVEGILSDQERFANVTPVAENLIIDEVLGEATHVIPIEELQTVQVTLDDDLDNLRVRAHRIGLLQVMSNLILNAYESIKRSDTTEGTIRVAANDEMVDEQPMVRVTIRDNGSGFDADTRTQIFQRGFTSKTEGNSSGLGLHWCANAVASMGGRISASSSGDGCGAEFHVLLPAARGG